VGVSLARTGLLTLALALGTAIAHPAQAQYFSWQPPSWLGSPNDPARVELGAGAFDVTPSSSHPDSRTAAELRAEYHFRDTLWFLQPFVGVSGTSGGGFYGYGGLGFDINFTPNWVLTPNAAAGYFARGGGTNLGSWWEFRTGAELAYRMPDYSRIGVNFNHTSNAGLTKRNPGEQSVVLTYSVPMP